MSSTIRISSSCRRSPRREKSRDGRAVEDFGAGDVLEVAGGPYKGLVVPFTKEVVPEVDLEIGTVTVDPPDGLLEPPEGEAKETE